MLSSSFESVAIIVIEYSFFFSKSGSALHGQRAAKLRVPLSIVEIELVLISRPPSVNSNPSLTTS